MLLVVWWSFTLPPHAIFPYTPVLRYTASVDDSRPITPPATDRNQVFVAVSVAPARTIVLDAEGGISEIWSNTADNVFYYSLLVRRHTLTGPLEIYSPSVHAQYTALIPVVDWEPTGQVYVAAGHAAHEQQAIAKKNTRTAIDSLARR
jgi:hypothetical protein